MKSTVRLVETTNNVGRVDIIIDGELYARNQVPQRAIAHLTEMGMSEPVAINLVNASITKAFRILCKNSRGEIRTDSNGFCTACGKSFVTHSKARQ